MEGAGFVAGLGAFAFWMFIAVAVASGVWSDTKEKQEKQRTLRDLIAKTENLDEETIAKLTALVEGDRNEKAKGTKEGLEIAHKITMAVAPGLALLGLMVGAFWELLGVAALVGCVSYGLLMASRTVKIEDEAARL